MVALRYQRHSRSGDTGLGDAAAPPYLRTHFPHRGFRPCCRRRSAPLPASFLVLFPSGRLHYDPARHGRDQRDCAGFFVEAAFRLKVCCLVQHCDCRYQLSRLGPSYVRVWPVAFFRSGFLAPKLHGCDPLRDQGLQLAWDDAQGIHSLRCADALCDRVYRSVYGRRLDWPLRRGAGRRRPFSRHLFCHRPLSLRYGGRNGVGLFRGAAFLVAEDHGEELPRDVGARSGAHHLHRLQFYLFSPIHSRLPWDAPALSFLSPGVPRPERPLLGRRNYSRRWLSAAALLSDLVFAARRACKRQSLGRDRPRVENLIAPAVREFCGHPRCHGAALQLSAAESYAQPCLRPQSRTSFSIRAPLTRRSRPSRACGSFWQRKCFSSARSSLPGSMRALSIGTANTVILITGSFAYSAGLAFAENGHNRLLILCCTIAWLLGLAFMILKFGIEWRDDFNRHMFPGPDFAITGPPGGGARLFWVFYFFGTFIHGLHLAVGLGLVAWIVWRASRGDFSPKYHTPVTAVGLYWSFVDVVWLILYPLIYLIGRAP